MATEPPAAPPWVYQQPVAIVEEQIGRMNARADSSLSTANAVIGDLANFDIGSEGTGPPNIGFPAIPDSAIARPDRPSILQFGGIDPFATPDFTVPTDLLAQIDTILAGIPTIGAFVSPIGSLQIPNPPGAIDTSGAPTRPTLQDVAIPSDPQYQAPGMGALLDITLPAPLTLTFDDYHDDNPAFEGTAVSTVLQFHEPAYQPLVLNELSATIKAMLAGDFIMPAIVQAMLFDRERAQEDENALAATQEAFDTWAGRGFPLPPGMLVEQVNVAQQKAALAKNDRARDILTKSAEWEIENLRSAVTTGIQLETTLIAQFNNVAQRVFDGAKARLESDVAMFGQYVGLYNARQAARQVAVAIFNAKIEQAKLRLEQWKTLLEAEQIKGTLNEQTVRVFSAQVAALANIIEIFKARMQGAQIKSEINKNLIDGYKSDVEAYGQTLQARKVVFDAYDSQMRGVESQARIVEAAARAFAATAEAQSAIANVKISAIRGKVEVINIGTQKFVALSNVERDKIGAQATAIDAKARAFGADVQRYAAELGADTEEARLKITISEARLRNNLAFYETRVREYDQAMSRMIERGRVIVAALSASGQMAASLASGAMAAMHVQASVSGSGNAGTSWSTSTSYSENHNFEEEA